MLKDAAAKSVGAQAEKDMSVIKAYIGKATLESVGGDRLGLMIPLSEFTTLECKGISWKTRMKALAQMAPDTLFEEYSYMSGGKRIDGMCVALRVQW